MEKPQFFATPAQWRRWLAAHHDSETELWVGFYKKGSGRPSITWPESVDEALCYGWIDGLRKGVDEDAYKIRFTPRKKTSIWSNVNTRRAKELVELGRMTPAGLRMFKERKEARAGVYAFEQKRETAALPPGYQRKLKANKAAWKYYSAQAPWYQRQTSWWVVSAKREETRLKRLATLIDDSAAGHRIGELRRD